MTRFSDMWPSESCEYAVTPPPDSLRVWVCPECGNAGMHSDKRELWHEMTCVERDRATVSVEYIPATDLEQLREQLKTEQEWLRNLRKREDEKNAELVNLRREVRALRERYGELEAAARRIVGDSDGETFAVTAGQLRELRAALRNLQ